MFNGIRDTLALWKLGLFTFRQTYQQSTTSGVILNKTNNPVDLNENLKED